MQKCNFQCHTIAALFTNDNPRKTLCSFLFHGKRLQLKLINWLQKDQSFKRSVQQHV